MKRDVGWITALIVAGLSSFGLSAGHLKPNGESAPIPFQADRLAGKAPAKESAEKSPCRGVGGLLGEFFSIDKSESLRMPKYCKQGPAVFAKIDRLTHTRFVIATLPDPVHTHLPLMFDRSAEAIQQAAQEEGFTYDRSWFPWDSSGTHSSPIGDQDLGESGKDRKEDQPGVLIFRKGIELGATASPYDAGLIVFIVGEEATAGINRSQFDHAVQWVDVLTQSAAPPAASDPPRIQILGPSFSGSFPSLAQLLKDPDNKRVLSRDTSQPLPVYSGQATSNLGVQWFVGEMKPIAPIRFFSFQQDDDTVLTRYYTFLANTGMKEMDRIALVSEDETAYGHDTHANDPSDPSPSKAPAVFYYPRDISALRAAYQQQSIFTASSPASSAETARQTLRDDLTDPETKSQDTIRGYGGNQTALSQEAALLHIVSELESHRSQFIVLRSSNPLDQLFLAHFFKRTYPEGRIAVLGSDLLLRRDVGPGGLNGILALSTFPLLPNADDWSKSAETDFDHTHRVFASANAEGIYIALRFLIHEPAPSFPCWIGKDLPNFVPPNCTPALLKLPDYARPFWEQIHGFDNNRPLTWLTVLGNDGFWPVAALDDPPDVQIATFQGPASSAPKLSWLSKLSRLLNPEPETRWPTVPLSLKVALLLAVIWSLFHAYCCLLPSITIKPDHRAYFVRSVPYWHTFLIIFSSVLVVIVFTALAWGYGWFSPVGGPHNTAWLFRILPFSVWLTGAFAVTANAWIESRVSHVATNKASLWPFRGSPASWRIGFVILVRATWQSLLAYVAATFAVYESFIFYIDGSLFTTVRVQTYIRSMNLTTGVSPVVPIVFLALGMYGWCWYCLKGMAGLSGGRPVLPCDQDLRIQASSVVAIKSSMDSADFLAMFSREHAGKPLEEEASPFHKVTWLWALAIFIFLLFVGPLIGNGIPIRALGVRQYSILICVWIALSSSILLSNLWQLTQVWRRLRTLLVFLDRMPLRRTMAALHDFSWGSIWKIGGNNLDLRYKLISRQFEGLGHLRSTLLEAQHTDHLRRIPRDKVKLWITQIDETRGLRADFAAWYADHWDKWRARDPRELFNLQESFSKTAGMILTQILIPFWSEEKTSLLTSVNEGASSLPEIPASVKNAEEAVCLVYLGFIQSVLGRMRSLMMGMVWLFLSIALVLPSYPFDPRPVLTGTVIFLFVIVAVTVFIVYAQIFRDSTLSHLTDTTPGELGSEFWLKFVGFGVGPVFGLLATVFPQLSGSLFSWLQPSLSSLK